MKVVALIVGLIVLGVVVDGQYFHGRYLNAAVQFSQQLARGFGLR